VSTRLRPGKPAACPMTPLLERVRRFIGRHNLAGPDTRMLVALSGGSDSVALTYILRDLQTTRDLCVVGLAHFNHQLRAAADDDERFCAHLAETLGWPMCVEREDVAALARREHLSIEVAARSARHAFLERARIHLKADVLAVAHTRDDQAETFLLRLVRGAGPRGLAAVHPRNGAVVRPLLCCRRRELRAYLAAEQVAYVEDESNTDVSIPRNRVRAELVPLLERRFNPQIVNVLADEADIARDTLQWIEAEADELLARSLKAAETSDLSLETCELDIGVLMAAPLALRRFAVWRAMTGAAGGRPVAFDHVESALRLTELAEAGAIDFPGHRVERIGPLLVLKSRVAATSRPSPQDGSNDFEYPLSIPGEVVVPSIQSVISAETWPAGVEDARAISADPAVAVVRHDLCSRHLRVRNRHPGDRFRPLGVGGTKKLQDFFVDRKVPRHRRDSVPLVVDETGRIIWVAGYGIDESFQVTDPAQAVVVLRLKLLGGPA
jgi:tRNA(Ile)-lysidine synthase